MVRAVVTIAAIVALAGPAWAFRGRVVDLQGKPVASAEVYVLGRPGEAITDAEGRFEWKPDPAPPFEILVILRGGVYMKPVLIERLDPAAELTVTVAPLVSESIVVSGTAPGIESTPAAGTTTLSASEISVRQPANLIQALENVAGVSQVSEGQAAVPAVRGLFGGRTLILIDGARVTSERRVGASATFLDPAMLDSVDVSRGPGSVAYGSDAFGGVISVRTRRVTPGAPWAARVSGTLGAGVPERRLAAEVSRGLPAGGILVAAHARAAGDWSSPRGAVLNSSYHDSGLLARAEHQIGRAVVGVGWQSDFGRDIGRPRSNSHIVRFSYPQEDSHRFTASVDVQDVLGFQRIGLRAFLGAYDQTTDQDRAATATAGRRLERAVVSANDFQTRGFVERLLGRARFEAGIDLNGRYGLHATDRIETYDLVGGLLDARETVSIDRAARVDTGVYASLDAAVAARLTMAGGLRGDRVAATNTGGYFGDRSTAHGAASGFFAVTAGSFRGLSATVQVARGFRDPTLSDRFYRGPTGRGFLTGNPALDPETSRQVDVALRYAAGRYRLAAFYYHYRIQDLIERYEAGTDFFFFRNQGRARIRGVELEAQAQLGPALTLELAAQASEGTALDGSTFLDGIAPVTVSAQVRRQFGWRAFAQVRAAVFAADNRPGPTERVVPGYTLVDLSAGYAVTKALEVRGLARNLLNQEYFASQDVRAVLAPGRSASVVAAVRF